MSATRRARMKPTARPKRMPAGRESTLRANQPMRSPAMMPLTTEPATILAIWGAVSGAETRAESPSKIRVEHARDALDRRLTIGEEEQARRVPLAVITELLRGGVAIPGLARGC